MPPSSAGRFRRPCLVPDYRKAFSLPWRPATCCRILSALRLKKGFSWEARAENLNGQAAKNGTIARTRIGASTLMFGKRDFPRTRKKGTSLKMQTDPSIAGGAHTAGGRGQGYPRQTGSMLPTARACSMFNKMCSKCTRDLRQHLT
jgi:hypothetical protein